MRYRSLALGLVITLVGGACASPRAALGTNQSMCFPAIAIAAEAVGHQGRFAGVKRSNATAPRGAACVVAFHGKFDPARIPLLTGPNRTGSYAIVVVGLRSRQAHLVHLADAAPKGFSHL